MTPAERPSITSSQLLRLHVMTAVLLVASDTTFAEVEYVIQLSVDGVNARILQAEMASHPAEYSNWQRLVDEGASTFNARADLTHTRTLPNHTSMVTGRPVSQPAGQPAVVHHGYVDNGRPQAEWTLHNQGNARVPYVESTWGVAHDNGLTTACYASKSKFAIFDQSYGPNTGAPDITGPHDDGRDKIDGYYHVESHFYHERILDARNLHVAFLADMAANHWNYTFLHYTDPDKGGHASGWGTDAYKNSLKQVDGYLADLFELMETDPVLRGKVVLLVTSDHGGVGTNHRDQTKAANYTIPFMAFGAGVRAGADLYALNAAHRTDPGRGRPNFGPSGQPIRNADAANLALGLLGLAAIPGSTVNADQALSIGIAAPTVPSARVRDTKARDVPSSRRTQ